MRRSRRSLLCLAVATGALVFPGPSVVARVPEPAATPRVVEERAVGDRLLDVTVSSPALGRTARVRLLLPRRWSSEPNRRWPVLYLLHPALESCCGQGGEYKAWTAQTDVAKLTARTDVLVVMPEGDQAGWYSDWWNHGKGGKPRWEKFHLVELRRILEDRYRAGSRRAIAGPSMGGFGALSYAARHPGMFRAAASYSGAVHTRQAPWIAQGSLLRALQSPFALWGDLNLQSAVWKAHNPYDLARRLKGTSVFLSVGDGRPGPLDPPGTLPDPLEVSMLMQAKSVATKLQGFGGQVETDFYGPGTHVWPYWGRELHRSFPLLMRALKPGQR